MAELTANAHCCRFQTREFLEKHEYINGLDVIKLYPWVENQMIILDSYDLYSYGLWVDGKIVIDVMDYMIQPHTRLIIEKAREKHSMLFI